MPSSDVDQKTGEDLLPMGKPGLAPSASNPSAGLPPSGLHGLSGVKVRLGFKVQCLGCQGDGHALAWVGITEGNYSLFCITRMHVLQPYHLPADWCQASAHQLSAGQAYCPPSQPGKELLARRGSPVSPGGRASKQSQLAQVWRLARTVELHL